MKPTIITKENGSALEMQDGYRPVLTVSTNGKSLAVQFDRAMIPLLNDKKMEKVIVVIIDAFYRLRPDLRKQ